MPFPVARQPQFPSSISRISCRPVGLWACRSAACSLPPLPSPYSRPHLPLLIGLPHLPPRSMHSMPIHPALGGAGRRHFRDAITGMFSGPSEPQRCFRPAIPSAQHWPYIWGYFVGECRAVGRGGDEALSSLVRETAAGADRASRRQKRLQQLPEIKSQVVPRSRPCGLSQAGSPAGGAKVLAAVSRASTFLYILGEHFAASYCTQQLRARHQGCPSAPRGQPVACSGPCAGWAEPCPPSPTLVLPRPLRCPGWLAITALCEGPCPRAAVVGGARGSAES